MNKIVKRLVAVTMAFFMVPGAMPSIAMAAPVTGTSDVTVETSTTAQIGSASSASAVTLDGEYTTAEVKADLRSIILLGKDKVVNVSKYGVSASDMDALVAEVLEENYVDGLIKVTCAVSKGMATYLVIERSEALVTAVDEMEAVTENAKASDEAESDAGASVAAASAYSISAYAAEDETEGGGQEGAETTSGLTDEQKQQLTSLYALYLKTHEDYPQYLGVMDPYFYTKNTDTSPLGGMLVVAGIPQVAIDAGMVSYDDLFGCIMTFYLGNMATVKFYGEDLIAAKDEALNFVKNSGAKTYVDKLMVLMDWLSNRASFNMPYIMNQSQKDAEGNNITMMKAPSGNEPVNEYLASGDLEAYCKEVLTPIFEQGAMEDGRKEGKKVGYAAYIKENYKDAYDAVYAQMYQAVYDQVYEQAYSQMVEQGLSEEQAQGQADHVATVEAEYAVAQQVAQSLDSKSTATLNITIVDTNSNPNTLRTAEPLTKNGTKGEAVTFTADEIKAAAEAVTLPEGYVLGEQNYQNVSVNAGETETISFVATEQAELTATLHVVVTAGSEPLGRGDLTQTSRTAGTATFAAADIQAKAAGIIAGENYDLDSAQFADVEVTYGGEDTRTYTATAKTTEPVENGESGGDTGTTGNEGGDAENENEAVNSGETGDSNVTQEQSEEPVTVEDPAKEAQTQNDAAAEEGDGTAELDEEDNTEGTAEETTVDAAATAYAEAYAEEYAKQYAANYAAQVAPMYAEGLAPQVVGSWNGNLVGALCLDSCVCKSYTYAYNYIIQWMNPDVYGKNGASTDLSNADNWKSPDDLFYESKEVPATGDDGEPLKDGEGNPITTSEKTFSTDAGYVVDSVRITYNKSTTMFGEVPENFSSDHYWSAVKVDGEWYYIDSCYADIYIECMMRSRVETDGYINNLYFMISDASVREMYDGYFDSENGLDTLYDSRNSSGLSDDTSYEHTWFSYAKSQVYSDGSGYYYMFDDTDALNELGKKGNSDSSAWEEEEEPTEYKLVYRPMASKNSEETGGDSYDISADTSVQVLIDVNNGTFYNGETMEESALLKDLYSRFQEYTENYPGVYVSMAYADGIAYMSIGNTILAYDVKAHTLTRVLEYNKVYAQRDMDNAFGGMAFTVVDKDGEDTLSVSNPPISAINIFDGKMTVSLATNYAFISGKKDSNDADDPGYAFQETNYNASYVNYSDYGIDLGDYGGQLDGLIEQQDNDNDEFMWAANFVDTIKMSDLTASEHSYEAVTVDPTCGIDGYTENRCTTCGRIEDGTRKADEGTALEHHYIHFTETYYTKEDDKFKTGETFVCADCLHSVNYDDSDDADNTEWDALQAGDAASGHVYDYVSTEDGQMELSEDHSTITVSGGKLVCPSCDGKTLDFLSNDNSNITADGEVTVELDLDEPLTLEATPVKTSGDCEDGLEVTYAAEGTYKDVKFTVSESAKNDPGEHAYKASFQWEETKDEDGNITDYPSATATEAKCEGCGKTDKLGEVTVTKNSVEATCDKEGYDVYTATATGESGATYTEEKTITRSEALGHDYEAAFEWSEVKDEDGNAGYTATAALACKRCDATVESHEVDEVTKKTVDATCTEPGKDIYTATYTYEGKTYTGTKEVETKEALGHDYTAKFNWTETTDADGKKGYAATADLTCSVCQDTVTGQEATVKEEVVETTCTTDGKIVYKASLEYEGKTYTEDKNVETEKAWGHKYKAEFTWTKDDSAEGYKVTAVLTCEKGDETTEALECKVTKETKAASCTEPGTIYYTATVEYEGVTYTDKKTEETEGAVGHNYTAKFNWTETTDADGKKGYAATADLTCSVCQDTVTGQEATVKEEVVETTCTTDGKIVYKASLEYEGKTYTEDKNVETEKAWGHKYKAEFTWTKDDSAEGYKVTAVLTCEKGDETTEALECKVTKETKAASCTEPGTIYYTATVEYEGVTYTDKKTEETEGAVGHNYTAKFNWTETTDADGKKGYAATADLTCSVCQDTVTGQEATVKEEVVETTCTTDGKIVYKASLEYEGKTYTEDKNVETEKAWGHKYKAEFTWTKDDSAEGYKVTAVLTCEKGDETTEALECKVTKETKAASCTEPGTIYYTATVEYEGETYTDKKTEETEGAVGHNYTAKFNWTETTDADGKKGYAATADLTCSVCQDTVTGQEATVKEEVVETTCTTDGKIVYKASLEYEGKTYTEDKNVETEKAWGHKYKAEFTWTKDDSAEGYKVTAVLTCEKGDETTEALECKVTKETKAASCTEPGTIYYTATVEYEGETYTDKKTEETEGAVGHNYTAKFNWTETTDADGKKGYAATADLTCSVCQDTVTGQEATVKEEVVETTCTTDGKIVYKASLEYEGKTYTDDKNVETEKAWGHKYKAEFTWTKDDSAEGYKVTAVLTCEKGDETTEALECKVTKETKAASCTEPGTIYYTATVEYEGVTYTDKKTEETEGAVGHNYTAKFYWTETTDADGKSGYAATVDLTCSVCQDTVTGQKATVEEKVVEPTCTEDGAIVYTATLKYEEKTYTAEKKVASGKATGHKYEATFNWKKKDNADGYDVTATLICSECNEKHENLECKVTEKITKEPTLTSEGEIAYTATVEFEGKLYTSETKTESISKIDVKMPSIASTTNEIDGVKVTWDAVDGATSYQVYRKDDNAGKWSKLGEPVAATSYTDTTVESGETYAYSVEAIVKDGDSSVSTGYDETGCSVRYIAAPVITKIENSNGQMNVTWKKVPGAENYRLFVKCGKNWWDWDAVADTTGTSATFKGSSKVKFTSGKEYQFTVRCMDTDKAYTSAYDKTGKSLEYIAEPVISSVSNTVDGLKVSWKSVGGAEKYRLFVKTGKNWWDWTSVSDTTGTSATFKGISKLKLADGKTYQFTVRCVTADGKNYTSSYDKNGKSLLRMSNPVVTLANNTNGITVKWGKISGATGYYVYRKTGNGDWQKIATIKSGATVTYTDAAVKTKNNTEYSYTVRSYNGSTMSYYTGKKIIRLTTPTISSATNNKSKVITVKWDKNNSVTGYQVSYKTGNTEKTVTIKGKTNVSTTIKNLTKNKTYTVKVRSYRSLNGVNYYSGWSTAKNVKIKK